MSVCFPLFAICFAQPCEVFTYCKTNCRKTAHKDIVICVQFPKDYPRSRLILEMKSKTIPEKFMEGLVRVCDQELKRHVGKKQVRGH